MHKKNKSTRKIIDLKNYKYLQLHRDCNLCSRKFKARTIFDRYCDDCKGRNDVFRFSEWLPDLDASLTDQIPA